MKKNGRGSFLAMLWLTLGCLCLGVLLMLLTPRESRLSLTENRMLAGAPEISADSMVTGEFSAGVEEYLSDGFFARDQVISWTDGMLGLFDKRTEEEMHIQEAEEMDRLLTADAGGEEEAEPEATEEPAPTETPAPTPEATPVPTETPAPTATAEPEETPAVTAEPEETPAATPRAIVPLDENAVYTLKLTKVDGGATQVYDYPAENVMTFAGVLNKLTEMLPEDGEVHYLQVPSAGVARRIRTNLKTYNGWVSDVEDALQSQVKDNVYIHNAPALLSDAVAAKEDVFYQTDHHWTPLGAWYAVNSIMEKRGYPSLPYEEYEYDSKFIAKDKAGREDWLHLLEPLGPTHSYLLRHLTEVEELEFMNHEYRSYIAYINNTRLPWRRFTGGFGSQRKALLISDSFGNVFLPYLLPYYGEVHMTDLRDDYYDEELAGGTFAELVAYHQPDDIYVVLSTANGLNSHNSLKVFGDTISK